MIALKHRCEHVRRGANALFGSTHSAEEVRMKSALCGALERVTKVEEKALAHQLQNNYPVLGNILLLHVMS